MPIQQLSPAQVRTRLEAEPAPLLLDVRERWEVEVCSIAGSQNLPMSQLPGALASLDPQRETVVVCHHGMRSQQVAMFLERAGFAKLINLAGGIDAWAREVDPDMATY